MSTPSAAPASDEPKPDLSDKPRRPTDPPPREVSALEILATFNRIAISGFGGTLPWAFRILVERKKLVTAREFTEWLALGQVLPGPNVLNLSVMIGYHYAGYTGAAAGIAGLMGLPFFIMIAVGLAYDRVGQAALAQDALAGMSAVAVGLVLATAFKMAGSMHRRWRPWVFATVSFICVGVLRLPLLGVLAVLAPLGIFLAAREGA